MATTSCTPSYVARARSRHRVIVSRQKSAPSIRGSAAATRSACKFRIMGARSAHGSLSKFRIIGARSAHGSLSKFRIMGARRCPGGQIVPTATESGQLCVNGMSYSNRGSMWANSAVVVTVGAGFGDFGELSAEDADGAGVLVGLKFQEEMEARAAAMGGGELVCPVQVAVVHCCCCWCCWWWCWCCCCCCCRCCCCCCCLPGIVRPPNLCPSAPRGRVTIRHLRLSKLAPGDPVLSLQLMENKVLTSHGGKHWTARIWDLDTL